MTGRKGTLHAELMLRDPQQWSLSRDAAVTVEQGVIAAVETDAATAGGRGLLLLPALANAHDHGRGLRCTAYGATDQPLETWLPALYDAPRSDAYVSTAASLCRLARAGVGAVISCHAVQQPEKLLDELCGAARAATDVGVRLGLVVPMRDRNLLAYGSDSALLGLLAAEDRKAVASAWAGKPLPPARQIELVRSAAAACDGALVNIQLGPLGPQWVSDELFALTAEESARTGRRIHMHLLETRYQREWADAAYPHGLLHHLDRLGILSDRLTVAHGVWLRPDEIDLLAARGVVVSLNTCSNLRLRSGLAPAREMAKRGLAFGLGIDGFSIDDDDDALRELRLVRWLHDGPGLEPGLSPQQILTAATATGAQAVTGRSDIGCIEPGQAADIIAIDWAAVARDAIAPLNDPLEMLLARMARQHMRHLWVAGRQVVCDGVVLGVDESALEVMLLALARSDAPRIAERRPLAKRYQAALRLFYMKQMHRKVAMQTQRDKNGG